MTPTNVFGRTASALALLVLAQATAYAGPPQQMIDGYYDMCLKSTSMSKPYGESDLKGNAKLPAYCHCFSPLFAERAMKAAKYMQENPGKGPPGTAEQSNAEELAMRSACRKQVGLPAPTK